MRQGKIHFTHISLIVAGLIVGALIILAIRFFTYNPGKVHYHANFAVYINGQKEQFNNPIYYTDIEAACTVEDQMTPHERAHMHDNVNNVVHVEDHAVTWGQFFQNLGWIVDPRLIQTAQQLYLPDASHKITLMLNGQTTDNLVNRVIKDQDRLLVDYGDTSAQTLQQEYKAVPATAHSYDISPDPASCSGSKPVTTSNRLHHLF